jgi:general secretion pathway protein A
MLRTAATEVMGEESDGSRGESPRFWPLAVVAGLLVALAAGWWWQSRQLPPVTVEHDNAATGTAVPLDTVVSNPPPVDSMPAQPAAAALPVVVPAASETVTPEMAAPEWLLAPQEAWSRLWSLYSPAPLPATPCAGQVQDGLACVEGAAQTWDELSALDRPLLLDMITPERFAAGAVFLGSNGRSAWFATSGDVVEVQLAELGPAWTGRYRLLWHPPTGFMRPLGIGDNSPAVAQVALLFAQLDGQQQPLAGTRFAPALEARVRLFQRKHELEDDGVVGMQTLLKLNEALGIDPTAAAARDLLARHPGDMVNR